MKRQGLLSTTGLFLIVLIIGLTLHEWEDRVPLREDDEPRGPALVVEGAEAHSFSDAGQLSYRLTAERLTRFEKSLRTEMTAPRVEVIESGGSWTATADSGIVEGPDNNLLLAGNVSAERLGERPLRLTTDRLRYHPAGDRVQAPETVVIQHPGGETRAGHLEADIATGVLTLGGRVESRYEVPAS